MALIILLIMTILGVFGMNVSRLENLMAGNNQSQAQALSDSELALRDIEEITLDITQDNQINVPNFDLDNEYYRVGQVDTVALDWSAITHGTTSDGSIYVIEYDNPEWKGNSTKWQGSGLKAHLFTITSQTTSGKGARRTIQVVFGTDEAP
jgi:cytochrome c biogenesis protein ResB